MSTYISEEVAIEAGLIELNGYNQGAWIAFAPDWSGFATFSDEDDCLRYAVISTFNVAFVPWGFDVRTYVNQPAPKATS